MSKNIIGENDTNYKASDEKKYSQTKKRYAIMFRENRTFELYVGRAYFIFPPYHQETVDEDIINHPDFKQQEKNFSIREL